MKTARRQELRTNELAQHIDKVSDYVKQNMTTFSTVVLGAALVVAVILWMIRSRENHVMDAWASVSSHEMNEDPWAAVDRLQGIVDQNINPTISAEALSKIGAIAQMQMIAPSPGTTTQPAGRNWASVAEKAYSDLIAVQGDRKSVAAHAKIALGILAEDRNDFSKAREYYKQVAEDKSLVDSPFYVQADYRLKGLDQWSKPVEFAPPPPMVMMPPSPTPQMGSTTPNLQIMPTTKFPDNPAPAHPPIEVKMKPTTQPAAH